MSSKKTDYLKMHDWTEADPWRLAEVSENFKKMDKKAKDLDSTMAATVSTAADAITTANGIDAKATDALTKSTEAVQNVSTAVQKANSAETKANEAKTVSDNALAKAGTAESIANGVQTQFNQVVITGDSSVEAAQARVNTSGQTYSTLKQRLDSEHQEVTVKLAETGEVIGTRSKGISDKGLWNDMEQRGYNAEWFGAVADYNPTTGIGSDNAVFLQSAIDSLATNETLLLRGKYLVSKKLTIKKSIKLVGLSEDTEIIFSGNDTALDVDLGTLLSESTLTTASIQATDQIVLSNPVAVGQILEIKDTTRLWPLDERPDLFYGEINEVKGVVGNSATLKHKLSSAYPIGTNVASYKMLEGFEIRNIKFTRKNKLVNSNTAIQIKRALRPFFNNVKIEGFGNTGIAETYCIGSKYDNIHVIDAFYPGVGLGYGIKVNGSIFTKINNSSFENVRRGVDFSGGLPSRFGKVSNSLCITDDNSTEQKWGFGTHGTSEYIEFIDCVVVGSYFGFSSRGNYLLFKDCHVYGASGYFATLGSGHTTVFDGCRLSKDFLFSGGKFRQASGFISASSMDYGVGRNNLTINNCYAEISSWFIYVSSLEGVKLPEVVINNLKVYGDTGAIKIIEAPETAVSRSIKLIINNIDFTTIGSSNPYNPPINAGANNTVTVVKNKLEVETAVTNKPLYVGQVAVVAGTGYMATGTTSAADWKRITV